MLTVSRRRFLQTLGLGATAFVAPSIAKAQSKQDKPNIIFIMVDDMGYADMGCYGSKAIQTPRLDQMAAEGMKFTNAYSGCTVCAPARSTLMTGTHMGHTSVRGNTGGISLTENDVTVAEVLKKAGYDTGGFGKWGLADLNTPGVPEKHGFDIFYGYYHQIHAHYYFPEYLIRNGQKEMLPGNKDKQKGEFSHYLIFEEMLKFIRANHDRPFFCYAPWTPPHGKYELPEDEPARALYEGNKWSKEAKVVAAMTTMLDTHVGRLLDLLKELGIDENTVIFFCSDNGASERFEGELDSSGPLKGRKRDMYEGGIRVPMLARWPKKIQAGSVSDLPVYFPDVMPTLADLAGVSSLLPPEIDGLSVAPTLLGRGRQKKHKCLYWEWPFYDWKKKNYPDNGLMQAVRSGKWKLLRHRQDEPWQLYDLSNDIGEKNDIAADHPKVVERLTKWIAANRTEPRPQIEPKAPEGKRYR